MSETTTATTGGLVTSHADVVTTAPGRYAKQLASHLGRKVPAQETATGYHLEIAGGACALVVRTDEGVLRLEAAAPDDETLERVEGVVGRHLVRFGARAELLVEWSTGRVHSTTEDPAQP